MLHLGHVNPVLFAMSTKPLDPDDALLEVHRNDEPIGVASNVEHDPLGCNDTRSRVKPLDISGISPPRPPYFTKPRSERCFESGMILVPRARRDKLAQSPSRDD